jgi:hypothetical protein
LAKAIFSIKVNGRAFLALVVLMSVFNDGDGWSRLALALVNYPAATLRRSLKEGPCMC